MHSLLRAVLLITLSLALASPGEAALKVTRQGPRSGTIGGKIRAALFKAGVRHGRVVVKVRRGRRVWSVSVRLYKPGKRGAVFSGALRARRGRLSWAAANSLARRAAAAYRRGASRREPPVKVVDPDADGDDDKDDGDVEVTDPDADKADEEKPAPRPEPRPAPQPQPAGDADSEGNDDVPTYKPKGEQPKPAADADDAGEAPTPQPTVAQTDPKPMDEDLGFEVGKESGGEGETTKIKKRSKRKRRAARSDESDDRVVVRAHAGLGLAWRRFLLDAQDDAVNYETGIFSQFFFRTEIYPLHLITRSGIADVGIRFAYAHSAGLKSEVEKGGSLNESINTNIVRVWGGLNWRLPRFSSPGMPRIELRLGIAHMDFAVEGIEALDTSFTAMAAGGSIVVPIWRRWIEATLDAEYRMLVRSRSVSLQPYMVKTASIQGFNLEGGLCGKVFGNLGYRATVTAERFLGDLTSLNGGADMLVRDWYISTDLALTYEM